MKIKKLIKLLEILEGKCNTYGNYGGRKNNLLPQDMYSLGIYTKENGETVMINDMDFIHVIRAFQKMQDTLSQEVRRDTQEGRVADLLEENDFLREELNQIKTSPIFMFSEIPNDNHGDVLVKSMKTYLNNKRYKMRVRGQYLDHDKMENGETWKTFEREVPLDRAKCMRVYIDEKK